MTSLAINRPMYYNLRWDDRCPYQMCSTVFVFNHQKDDLCDYQLGSFGEITGVKTILKHFQRISA